MKDYKTLPNAKKHVEYTFSSNAVISKLDELYTQMNDLFTDFSTNHQTNLNTGNKAAGTRARKAIGEVKKLVTEYRKASVEAGK